MVFLGEDVGAAGGAFKATEGLKERFGDRVRDTPISEQAIVGAAIGAALMGLRPVAEIMFADFAGVCFDQIVNTLPSTATRPVARQRAGHDPDGQRRRRRVRRRSTPSRPRTGS